MRCLHGNLDCPTANGRLCKSLLSLKKSLFPKAGESANTAESLSRKHKASGSVTYIADNRHTNQENWKSKWNTVGNTEKGEDSVTCKDCIHQPVCDVWGGLFPTRNDVERICDHFTNVEVLGFEAFWKRQFEAKTDK